MAKTEWRFTTLDRRGDRHGDDGSTERKVNVSDIGEVTNGLIDSIRRKNVARFSHIIAELFVYPGCLGKNESHGGDGDEWYYTKYEYYYARPTIEAFLFEHPLKLLAVVNELIQLNDERFYDAFISALENTDIKKETIFAWTPVIRDQIISGLEKVQAYATQLNAEKASKGLVVEQLHYELGGMVRNYVQHGAADTDSANFNNLRFKLQLIEKLQSKDDELSMHRGWKRVVSNIIFGFFTAGLALLAHRAIYGEWLFFNKTASQEKLLDVEKAIGFNP